MGTGNRVAHFNREVDPSCNFCVKNQPLPAPLETFTHIFHDCPEVEKVFTRFSDKYFVEQISRENYFNGDFVGTKRDLAVTNLLLDAMLFGTQFGNVNYKKIICPFTQLKMRLYIY